MSRGQFAGEWEKFAAEHVPNDASEAQREATRVAFYFGAGAFFDLLMSRHETQLEKLSALTKLQDELRDFNEALIAKYPAREKGKPNQ